MLNDLIYNDEDIDRPLRQLLLREVDVDEELHQRAPDQRDHDEGGRQYSLEFQFHQPFSCQPYQKARLF